MAPVEHLGHLTNRIKGGRNAELQAFTAAKARSIRFFMTAGLMNTHSGPAALPGSPPLGDQLLADRGSVADCLKESLKNQWLRPCSPGQKSRADSIKRGTLRDKGQNRIEITLGRLKAWRRIATR